MASVNKRYEEDEEEIIHEDDSQISYEDQLKRSVLGCLLWEDTFYEGKEEIYDRIKRLCGLVDNEVIQQLVLETKYVMKLRHIPLFLIVQLLNKGHNVKRLVAFTCSRPDDMTELLALYRKENDNKKSFPKSLLKGLAIKLTKFDEYHLAKYKNKGKQFSIKDVILLTHPKPKDDEQAKLFKRVIEDKMKTPKTWEVLYSQARNADDKRKVWETLVEENNIGGLATLRNLRNMEMVKFDNIKKAISNIYDPMILPIEFIKAGQIMPKYQSQLEEKFLELFTKKEKIKGKTLLLVDVSASMGYDEKPNDNRSKALAMIAKEICENIEICTFGDVVRNVDHKLRGFALADEVGAIDEGTYLKKAVKQINETKSFDRIIIITDEQSSDGIEDLKKDAKGYIINVANYEKGVGYSTYTHINGWSDAVLQYIVEIEKGL